MFIQGEKLVFKLKFFSFAGQYPYRDCEISKIVLHLIHITVNTLNAQYHSCKPHATAGPLYSDNSNISRYSEKEKGTFNTLICVRVIDLIRWVLQMLQKWVNMVWTLEYNSWNWVWDVTHLTRIAKDSKRCSQLLCRLSIAQWSHISWGGCILGLVLQSPCLNSPWPFLWQCQLILTTHKMCNQPDTTLWLNFVITSNRSKYWYWKKKTMNSVYSLLFFLKELKLMRLMQVCRFMSKCKRMVQYFVSGGELCMCLPGVAEVLGWGVNLGLQMPLCH